MTENAANELLALATKPQTIDADGSISEAAQAMGLQHVGSLIVTENAHPVGLVTDRDLVMAGLLRAPGTSAPTVGEIASRPLLSVSVDDSLVDATRLMEHHCVRRIAVLDASGALSGVLSADDVLIALGRSADGLARAIAREFREEIEPTTGSSSAFGRE